MKVSSKFKSMYYIVVKQYTNSKRAAKQCNVGFVKHLLYLYSRGAKMANQLIQTE